MVHGVIQTAGLTTSYWKLSRDVGGTDVLRLEITSWAASLRIYYRCPHALTGYIFMRSTKARFDRLKGRLVFSMKKEVSPLKESAEKTKPE